MRLGTWLVPAIFVTLLALLTLVLRFSVSKTFFFGNNLGFCSQNCPGFIPDYHLIGLILLSYAFLYMIAVSIVYLFQEITHRPPILPMIFFAIMWLFVLIFASFVFWYGSNQDLDPDYIALDHTRRISAELMAERMQSVAYPERVDIEPQIGELPPTRNVTEIATWITKNRDRVDKGLLILKIKELTGAKSTIEHDVVSAQFTELWLYEDQLSNQMDTLSIAAFINELTEPTTTPAYLETEQEYLTQFRDPVSYGSYTEALLDRKQFYDRNLISNEFGTTRTSHEIDDRQRILFTISTDTPFSSDSKFTLIHPDGRTIPLPIAGGRTFRNRITTPLSNYTIHPDYSDDPIPVSWYEEGNSYIMIGLDQRDPAFAPYVGVWTIESTAPIGTRVTTGVSQTYN